MSVLKDKSEENFQAIDILISSKLKAPVIHCAYYSSLQLVIHYFNIHCNVSQEEIQSGVNSEGSHNFYLNNFVTELKGLDRRNAVIFYTYFNQFKNKRKTADYSNIEISDDDLKEARDRAKKIKKFLKLVDENGECKNIHII